MPLSGSVYPRSMKTRLLALALITLPLLACEGPAAPSLMFPARADAGIEFDAGTPTNEEDERDDPLNPGGIPLNCTELTQCMATCSGSRCGPKCLERADARTQEIYSRVSVCAANNDCRDPDCIQENCAEAWLDCQENIHPDERPDCPTMRHCLLGCVEDVECEADCRAAAHQSTVVALNNLNGCSASANCVDEACRRETCPDELAACYPEAEIDRLTCAELVQCLDACEGPGACQENCRSEARPAARRNLQALDDCRVACGPDLAACRSLCPSEFARCDP